MREKEKGRVTHKDEENVALRCPVRPVEELGLGESLIHQMKSLRRGRRHEHC